MSTRSEKFLELLRWLGLNETTISVEFESYKGGVLRLRIGGVEYGYECDSQIAKEIEEKLASLDDTHTGFSVLNPYKKKMKHIFGGKKFAA
jgi:hypothetical protein